MFKKTIMLSVLAKAILIIGLAIYPPVTEGCGVICDNIMMIPIMGFIILIGSLGKKLIEKRKLADLHRKAEYIKLMFLKEGYDLSDPLQRYS